MLEKVVKKNQDNICFWYISIIAVLMPLAEFIGQCLGYVTITQSFILAGWGFLGLALIGAFLMLNRKSIVGSDCFVITLFLFVVISLVFSESIDCIEIDFHNKEMLPHFCAYFALMFAASLISSEKVRKRVLYLFMGLFIFNSIIGFFQSIGYELVFSYIHPDRHTEHKMIYGLTQHSNFYAGLSVLFDALTLGYFLYYANTKAKKVVSLLLYILAFYCSMHTYAKIAWVGNIALFVFYYIAYFILKKNNDFNFKENIWKLSVCLFISLVIVGMFMIFTDEIANDIGDARIGGDYSYRDFGAERGLVWEVGLRTVKDHWWHGVGLDNYAYSFYVFPEWKPGDMYTNRGHNDFIHTLVTQGVFAFINYVALIVYATVLSVKYILKKYKDETSYMTMIFLGMMISYVAQSLFNCSVINVAMYYWIVMGLCLPRHRQKVIDI